MGPDVPSPSSRRAWIEIAIDTQLDELKEVALLAEGVDRNGIPVARTRKPAVALLAEGVDRNYVEHIDDLDDVRVALLAEGVDRNGLVQWPSFTNLASPSSRRAWIEIATTTA